MRLPPFGSIAHFPNLPGSRFRLGTGGLAGSLPYPWRVGLVRRHPFLTLIFLIGSLPVVALLALEAVQHTRACTAWRAEVDARAGMPTKLSAFDEYHRGEMPVDEYYGRVRDHVAYELRASRPLFCE